VKYERRRREERGCRWGTYRKESRKGEGRRKGGTIVEGRGRREKKK
jgi:hypothetical protein